MPYLSALEVCSQRGAIQIHVYLYLTYKHCDSPGKRQRQWSSTDNKCIWVWHNQWRRYTRANGMAGRFTVLAPALPNALLCFGNSVNRKSALAAFVFWGRRLKKVVLTFFEEKSASRWPGWRMFWPRNYLAPLMHWRCHWAQCIHTDMESLKVKVEVRVTDTTMRTLNSSTTVDLTSLRTTRPSRNFLSSCRSFLSSSVTAEFSCSSSWCCLASYNTVTHTFCFMYKLDSFRRRRINAPAKKNWQPVQTGLDWARFNVPPNTL